MDETIILRRVRCFRNSEEIAEYIGESPRNIARLVLDEKLPAWKRGGTGNWRAVDIDLDYWMRSQARRWTQRSAIDAENDPEKGVNM